MNDMNSGMKFISSIIHLIICFLEYICEIVMKPGGTIGNLITQ